MKIYLSSILTAFLLTISCNTTTNKATKSEKRYADYDLSMYPKSNDSIKRHVVEVPIEENEGLYNLEIWAGQTKKVDCNRHSIPGTFTKKTVKGWGYSYYEFTTKEHQISTRMGCPDNVLTEKFILSKTEHVKYNSKLPVVVYCPSNLEIKYTIWSKSNIPTKAKIK